MRPCDPVTVVAVGGNALSPPRGPQALSAEREVVSRISAELAGLEDGPSNTVWYDVVEEQS